jgi:membrane peptidoglycan carboxypeptidase
VPSLVAVIEVTRLLFELRPGPFVASKTGTASATMNTWIVGHTWRWMTTIWIGNDRRQRTRGLRAGFLCTLESILGGHP